MVRRFVERGNKRTKIFYVFEEVLCFGRSSFFSFFEVRFFRSSGTMENAKQTYERILANPDFRASLAALQDDELGNLYKTHPMYKFYQDRKTEQPYRIFGVLRRLGGKLGVHAVSAHIGWINDIVGGVLAEDIELVEAWNEDQLALIELCGSPRIFLEPAGWGALIMNS